MALLTQLFGDHYVLFMLLLFVAVFLAVEGLYLLWVTYKSPEARRIDERLQALTGKDAQGRPATILKPDPRVGTGMVDRWLSEVPRVQGLQDLLAQAGSQHSPGTLITSCAVMGLIGMVLTSMISFLPSLIAIPMGLSLGTIPFLRVLRQRTRRLRKIEEQLPDAIDLMSRALKAGHAFPSALQMVGEETQEPIRAEFRKVHEEINFGVSAQTALMNLAGRVPSSDMRYFIIAVLIQRDTGGNLTEILGNISTLIRQRLKLFLKVRVLSAEGRMSGWVLGLLPFVLAGIINLINPEFMSVLWTDKLGNTLIGAALFLMAMGALWMRKIVRIRV